MTRTTVFLLLLSCCIPAGLFAQEAQDDSGSSVCTFQDGRQLTARFRRPFTKTEKPQPGKVWAPGGEALTLFTESEVTLGNATLPVGAFTMYLIPNKKDWTLIVSRNTNVTAAYDEKQDLARAAMETGALSRPQDQFTVQFGHIAPQRCEINVDFGPTRAWVEFRQK